MTRLKRGRAGALALGVAALTFGCDDPEPTAPASDRGVAPVIAFGEEPPPPPGPKAPPLWMTCGGRIDDPPGTGEHNTPDSHQFQTFGCVVGDKDGDGAVEGQLQWVDHTPDRRIDGSPLNMHSVSWTSAVAAGDCLDGGLRAEGEIEIKNTGEVRPFTVFLCDNGEPGSRDIIEIDVPGFYHARGILTGGNIQAHMRGGGN